MSVMFVSRRLSCAGAKILCLAMFITGFLLAPGTAFARSVVASGAIDVTVLDASRGEVLAGVEVTALERRSSSKFRWRARATTDAGGRVHFELPGLGQPPGASYVFRAKPFVESP